MSWSLILLVRYVRHKVALYDHRDSPHFAGKVDVFEQDRECFRDHTLADPDREYDFRVDLGHRLAFGDIHDIRWCERECPVHDHDVLGSVFISSIFKGKRTFLGMSECSRFGGLSYPLIRSVVPRFKDLQVNVVIRMLSRKAGVLAAKALSTLATMV